MRKLLLIVFIFATSALTAFAQDGREGLLDLLGVVPDQMEFRQSLISFVDYYAIAAARDGAEIPDSWDTFQNSDEPEHVLYRAALQGLSSGPDLFVYLPEADLWQETVGFSFFDIERTMTFGSLPDVGNIYVGDFDTEAITDAHTARNYTSDALGDFTMWCGDVGCDNGAHMDLANRNLGNPFGGDLGRQQPFIISDTMIIHSGAVPILIASEDAATDKINSLADNTNYVTAINSIDPEAIVIQAMFVHPSQILLDVASFVIEGDVEGAEEMMTGLSTVPPYNLLMIADTATETEQVAYVTLVYNSLDDAEIAAENIPDRIDTMDSMQFVRPLTEVFEDRNITDIVATAREDEVNDLAVTVLEFRAPLASNEIEEGPLGTVSSSLVYRLLVQMVYSRDINWLAVAMPDS